MKHPAISTSTITMPRIRAADRISLRFIGLMVTGLVPLWLGEILAAITTNVANTRAIRWHDNDVRFGGDFARGDKGGMQWSHRVTLPGESLPTVNLTIINECHPLRMPSRAAHGPPATSS